MLAKTRVLITCGGRYLELKLRCDPGSPSAFSALGVKSLRERVCKDARRLCGESIKLARMEGGSFSTSLGGVETTVVSNVSLKISHFLLQMLSRPSRSVIVEGGGGMSWKAEVIRAWVCGMSRLRKDLVALGYRERRVASVLVVGQGQALVLAP